MGSLTQAVPGRSRQHWRHRATRQSGPECITGCQVKVESKMFRAVLMMFSLVAFSVAQRRPPPGFDDYEDQNSGNSVQGRARVWMWASFPTRGGSGPSSILIRG